MPRTYWQVTAEMLPSNLRHRRSGPVGTSGRAGTGQFSSAMSHSQIPCRPSVACDISVRKLQRTWHGEDCELRDIVTDCNRSFEASVRYSLWATSERPPGAAGSRNGCLSCLQELAGRMVNGRTFALGAVGGSGVPVQLALAARAVAWPVQRPGRRLSRDPHACAARRRCR